MTAPVAEVFAALADPTRQRLLDLLAEAEHASAADLAGPLTVSRQAVEKHLRVLERADLVVVRRQRRRVSYAVRPAALRESADWLTARAQAWDRRLLAVKQAAEGVDADGSGQPGQTGSPARLDA